MKEKKRGYLIVISLLFLCFFPQKNVQAMEDISYDEIQAVIDETMGTGEGTIHFGEEVKKWMSGEKRFSLQEVIHILGLQIQSKWRENTNIIIRLLSIALFGALFTNFSNIFQNNQVSETGFYVAYLLLFTILTSTFITAASIAQKTLDSLLDFMKALVPSYFVAVTFSSGVSTSAVFYEGTLILISLVDAILVHGIIPLINFYFMLSLAANLTKEDMLSKCCELLETVISWTMKTLFGLVIGFHVIQGMIVPVADYVKSSAIMKTAKILPGIGNSLGTAAETILGTGVLIKNAIGAVGLVMIVVLCGMPVIQLAFHSLLYEISGAMLQPISDKRMIECISKTARAVKFLLYTVVTGAVLFLFSIAIITNSTNLKL